LTTLPSGLLKMNIVVRSLLTGKLHSQEFIMTSDQYHDLVYDLEKSVQQIFPEYTNDQREFLMSGATIDEWNDLLSQEDHD